MSLILKDFSIKSYNLFYFAQIFNVIRSFTIPLFTDGSKNVYGRKTDGWMNVKKTVRQCMS